MKEQKNEKPIGYAEYASEMKWRSTNTDSSEDTKSPVIKKEATDMTNPSTAFVPATKVATESVVRNAAVELAKKKSFPKTNLDFAAETIKAGGEVIKKLCDHKENAQAAGNLMAAALVSSSLQSAAEATTSIVEPELEFIRGYNKRLQDFDDNIFRSNEDIEILKAKEALKEKNLMSEAQYGKSMIAEDGKWKVCMVGVGGAAVVGILVSCTVLYKATHHGFFYKLFH